MFYQLFFFYYVCNLLNIPFGLSSPCHNNCYSNGFCNEFNICQCFAGFEGNDCARRSCPKGHRLSGTISDGNSSIHDLVECSGRGKCNYASGTCICQNEYTGYDCSRMKCMNDCSGHGYCISLRQAANLNIGYIFNRTTTYSQWDADIIYGCNCDLGFIGSDCSQMQCKSGLDPRVTSSYMQTTTLICDCSHSISCSGKFKFQMFGQPSKSWLSASSTKYDVANSIMSFPGIIFTNDISAYLIDGNASICNAQNVTTTKLLMSRFSSDYSSLSFYGNMLSNSFSNGLLYFETIQILECNCFEFTCVNGTFRLVFDGEISERIEIFSSVSIISESLMQMSSIINSGITVKMSKSSFSNICIPGIITNSTISFQASFGNVPQLQVLLSPLNFNKLDSIASTNDSNYISIISFSGQDSEMKICNGIGTCDYSSGQCICPYGWDADEIIGPCGKLVVNTSDWGGLGRCPGVSSIVSKSAAAVGLLKDFTSRKNYKTRLYISVDPIFNESHHAEHVLSTIEFYEWIGSNPSLTETKRNVFINLTCNSSAGPLIIDQGRNRLFFVDMNPKSTFIGYVSLNPDATKNFIAWVQLKYSVFGIALDTYFNRRRLFWSSPGINFQNDGIIEWAYIDEDKSPTIHSLSNSLKSYLIDPLGIAINILSGKLYWIDKNTSSSPFLSVLNSYEFDSGNIHQMIISDCEFCNLTDLVIDFSHNNTAFIIDNNSKSGSRIIGVNLNSPVYYNNETILYNQFIDWYSFHSVVTSLQILIEDPKYLALDSWNNLVLWSDFKMQEVNFDRIFEVALDFSTPGIGYASSRIQGIASNITFAPVGVIIDRGLGSPQWGDYLDCFGHGQCLGYSGNWECQCDDGYFGNCNMKSCPYGLAWFHEPTSNEIAHNIYMECSNMGVCNYKKGICKCIEGFEGAACERMSCPGMVSNAFSCSGAGRCLSNEYFYGSNSFNAWDRDMVYSCVADTYGYYHEDSNINPLSYVATASGSLLDTYECVSATNYKIPFERSYNTQMFQCLASSGTFQLAFRNVLSEVISVSTTIGEFSYVLNNMQSIGRVTVNIINDELNLVNPVCDPFGNTLIKIKFLTELGNIPLLQIKSNSLVPSNTISIIYGYLQSNEIIYECGGFGECHNTLGKCKCWDNYGSSDGFGDDGNLGDCGKNLIL